MNISVQKTVEYTFFFILLLASAYLMWSLIAPFAKTIALAAVLVSICYPLYEKVHRRIPYGNGSVAALIMLIVILLIVILPLIILGSFLFREARTIYTLFSTSGTAGTAFVKSFNDIEALIRHIVPNFSFDIGHVVQQTAQFMTQHMVNIFAGAASTIFLVFLAAIAMFYFFKDGKHLTEYLIRLSPLDNIKDTRILSHIARSVRGVVVGTISVAIIQGILTAIGLSLFGFDRAILWGSIASIGALIPGVGTTIVFAPAIIYVFVKGSTLSALLLLLWAVLAVGLIDNLLGPYMMSRGNDTHPFLILISVLGGIVAFGPLGFILGPVILSLFLTLLDIYHSYYEQG